MKIPKIIPILLIISSANLSAQVKTTDKPNDDKAKKAAALIEIFHKHKQLKKELAELSANIKRLKLENEFLSEKKRSETLKEDAITAAKRRKTKELQDELDRQVAQAKAHSDLAESRADLAESEFKLKKARWEQKTELLNAEIEALNSAKKRQNFADSKPIRLKKPLQEDGTLVISDRRISLNGPIYSETADYITTRIHYYNNKNKELPIFIVIDDSPGGSVMAGYRILKAMEGSDAPVHVLVKSFAASMAASITTLAEKSYAYPNAIILHHQISSSYFFTTMNLTQQKEAYKDSQKWWDKLAGPIAKKMGISTDEFIKRMYKKNSDGDWSEFATEAIKLKWVDHIVKRVQETATIVNPDSIEKDDNDDDDDDIFSLKEIKDNNGKPCIYLPRLNPMDVYFMYNPDGYYRLR